MKVLILPTQRITLGGCGLAWQVEDVLHMDEKTGQQIATDQRIIFGEGLHRLVGDVV